MKTINLALFVLLVGVLSAGWIAASSRAAAAPPRQRLARSLTPEQIADFVTNAPPAAKVSVPLHNLRPWTNGVSYAVADSATHEGAVYLCVQAHRSQSDWSPPVVPALWRRIRAAVEAPDAIPAWVQPLGAHDAYAKGARVRHAGKTWESIINANVWAPGVYGWQEVSAP